MTLTEEIAHLLDTLGVGTYQTDGTPGGTIYLTTLPTTPDVALAVATYGGAEADSLGRWAEPSIQVRTRGTATDARTGEALAQAALQALGTVQPQQLAGGTWLGLCVALQSAPTYIGRDQSGRHEFTCNFRLHIERVA